MIEINNFTTSSIDENYLRQVANKILEQENKKDADLSIVFIGQGKMRKLNKRYKGKNRVTDVLAFPEMKIPLKEFKFGFFQKISGLGEIVICLREVKKNSKRFSVTFEEELTRILIHGILHLLGYDHEKSEKDSKKMEEKQNYYLANIREFIHKSY